MEFIDKILNNYKLSSKDYILKYKSDHWGKSFLNFSKNVSTQVGYLKNHFTGVNYDRFQIGFWIDTDFRKKGNENIRITIKILSHNHLLNSFEKSSVMLLYTFCFSSIVPGGFISVLTPTTLSRSFILECA